MPSNTLSAMEPNVFDTPPPHHDDFYVSTDKRLLDHRWLVANLLNQSWTECWTHERLTEAIRNSITFGVYQTDNRMVGFARVITDESTYSLVCDVVIDEAHRGHGLAKFLMGSIVNHPAVRPTVSLLRTGNPVAQSLYERFGYSGVTAMRRIPTCTS
jgi:GNAT superfamily N-acetyltransferase